MSWGVKIAILYLGFVAIIVTLVTMSMRQKFDLVADDYYQQEIAFQNVIDAGKNQSQLSAPVMLQTNEQNVRFVFPQEFAHAALKGTVHFYSDVNAAWDEKIDMETSVPVFSVPLAKLHRTAYQVKINWKVDGKSYYQSSQINL